ncbi:4902_t:CDS:2, partial [Acaulospora colombiana]
MTLYPIKLPNNPDLAKNVQKYMSTNPEPSWPATELHEIYPSTPPTKTVHFIVGLPSNVESLVQTPRSGKPPLLNITPPKQMYMNIDKVRESMNQSAQTLGQTIRELITQPRSTTWYPPGIITPEVLQFYKNLDIPSIRGKPNLLLHNLGKVPNKFVDNLLEGLDHSPRILCNVSGSGKTRLLLETLCHHWGFYFVVARGYDRIGSPDLQATIDSMEFTPNWNYDVFKNSPSVPPSTTDIQNASSSNGSIAFHRLSRMMLSRRFVFDTFIKVVKEVYNGVIPDTAKLDWLLLQILPDRFPLGQDPFTSIINDCLIGVTQEVLAQLHNELEPGRILGLDQNKPFLLVIDEIQVAGERYKTSFSDASGKKPRPVLRPIVQYLSETTLNGRVIVSGTGFSLENFKTVVTSGVGKEPLPWSVVYKTGDFDVRETQMDYVSAYLPSNFLSSPSGCHLKARMYEWLRGRHRFTARYLEELIGRTWKESCPAYPHKLFDAYVYAYTDFKPLDGDTAISKEEDDVDFDVAPIKIDSFLWNKIDEDQKLLEVLVQSMGEFTTKGKRPGWYDTCQQLVEYGLARFIGKNIKIGEPLPLVSLMRHFESKNLPISKSVWARLQTDKGKAFEEIVLLTITRLFQNGPKLSDVFRFHDPIPDWA